jgi:hypothetical protein
MVERTRRRIGRNGPAAGRAKPIVDKIKKVTTTTSKEVDTKKLSDRLVVIARDIDTRNVEIELRAGELVDLKAEAKEILDKMNLTEFDVPRVGTHQILVRNGNKSSTIDMVKFRELVTDDSQFYGAITVTKKAASDVLPAKTLDSITTEVAGKKGAPAYSFVPAGTKKK